ncbi:Fic family protein [Micromonospora zhanjiangensis]|uniref:Fic family protein n=1 Tax=Micromonospora zhanjiangensis TaxID=1522057 RepID=A0ABV8KWP9_9ACTN
MDPEKFTSQEFGEVTKQPGEDWAFWYFRPHAVPREITLSMDTILLLSGADAALGRLSGVGRLLPDPGVLVRPYLTREALASSRIEGTQASLSDVLQAEIGEEATESEDVQEVLNYQHALSRGIGLLEQLPISLRLLKEVHRTLLTGVRGQEKLPGEFRSSPVWIGSSNASPSTATFVPPIPGDMEDALADWERFVNEPSRLPLLIRCALMHYQFETIHPFLDGNGRIGRLLIILMLLEQQALSVPLLYLSAYMEDNRKEYYDRLQAVRERGEIQEWLQYFLRAVNTQADEASSRIGQLVDLREKYRLELKGGKSRAGEVMELFFSNPFITVKRVEKQLSVTNQGARNLIEALEQRNWLRKIGPFGRGGRIFWLCDDVYRIIN